jgi:hypothetical protein
VRARTARSFVLGDDGKATPFIFPQSGGQIVAKKIP